MGEQRELPVDKVFLYYAWPSRESMVLNYIVLALTVSVFSQFLLLLNKLETNHPFGTCAKKAEWNDWIYWDGVRNEV